MNLFIKNLFHQLSLAGGLVAFLLANQANAAVTFTENAGSSYYNSGWTISSSQPNNFGWFTWTNVTAPGAAGRVLDDSRNLASPGNYPNINTSGRSWGIYGSNGGTGSGESDAYGFLKDGAGNDYTLSVGQTLSLDIAVNLLNGSKGFAARDASGTRLFTLNIGGNNYVVQNAATGNGSIGNAYSDNTVFHIAVTQTNASRGVWSITRSGGVSTNVAGTYVGVVANFELYVSQTGSGSSNYLYANNISVVNNTCTLTYTAGVNGTISGTTTQTVNYGVSGSAVTAVPNTGYHFVNWSDGVATASRTDGNVMKNLNVTANFAVNTYTLTYTAGANGTISGTTPQTVNYGASGSPVTAVPNTGYHFVNWSDAVATPSRTDGNVANNISVTANFAINTYTLTYTAGANGTISGTTPQTINYGASGSAVTAVPNTGYRFANWSDGVATPSRTDSNVTNNLSVTANFAVNTIAAALDAPGLVWTNLGGWYIGDSSVAYDGVSCAADQLMLYGYCAPATAASSLTTAVTGPSLVSFWWKMDYVGGSPSLALLVDGQSVASYNSWGWSQQTVALSSGSHSLQWDHELNSFNPYGGENISVAYLDQVAVTPVICPIIAAQPQSNTVSGGSNGTFTVQAIGAVPLFYQWQFNSTNLPGATNVSLTITNVQLQNGGPYSLVVSNSCGTAISSNAILTVLLPPVITQQPSGQTVNAGSSATLTVSVNGAIPLWYYWRLNSSPVGTASTNNSYTIASAQTNDAGLYSVVVSNAYDTAVSSNVLLTVRTISVITYQPYGQGVYEGSIAQFYVYAAGPSFQYQWEFNGADIVGATNNILTLAGVMTNQAGLYSAIVSNSYGAVVSSNALLTVTPLAPNPALGDAVDAPDLVWRTGGWAAQTSTSAHDGVDDAYCILPYYESSTYWMGTTVVGPGTVSFYWAVDQGGDYCYGVYGFAAFMLDGTFVKGSTSYGWVREEFVLGPGKHTLHWEFYGNDSLYGFDYASAFVDQVTYTYNGPTPLITTASPLLAGVAGTAYSTTLAVSGSTAPYVWSLAAGSLPSGLSLSTNGVISGMPGLAVAASFTVQVVGGNGLSTNKVFGLTINPAITTTSPLPAGVVGAAYNQTLVASGGTTPYVWIITAGGLPSVLNLSSAGAITGTPNMLTNASFTVQVTDNNGLSSTKAFSLTVAGPPTITSASPLPAGVAGTAYSTTLAVSGSTAPYVWSLAAGSLPSGLSLSTNGVISGMPGLAVAASFTVQVVGGNGLSTNKVFGLTINPAITTTSPLPAGVVGAAYNQTLVASGGTTPYVWIITAGGLPSVLNLSSAGAITGTPNMLTNASFTVQVTDNNGLSSTKAFSLTVAGPPTITSASPLPAGVAGTAYSTTLAVSGSTAPYVWSLVAGSLPSGLSLSTNGVISGMPGLAFAASFTVQVVGGNGLSTNKVFGLTINPAITTTSPLPGGGVGAAYNLTLVASGGTVPYVWITTAGGLPLGLSLGTNGVISGTTTMVTNASFTVQVTDNNGLSSTKAFSLTIAIPLAEALDGAGMTWTNGGNVPWFGQTATTHDGVDAAQSGHITDGQESWMQTTLTGPGTLTYWRKVSSESGWDYLEFYIDGVLQSGRISGTVDWQKQTNNIAAGTHTVKWRYMKDPDCCASGLDAGWVDEVSYISSRPSIITTNGSLGFSNSLFGFNVSGPASQTNVVEGSTNLLDWTPLKTNVMGGSPVYFGDPDWTNYPGRFYRLRSP